MTADTSAASTSSDPTDDGARRVALAAFVGTAMEWYDFFIFTTAAALVFNVQFFVSHNALAATMASFATLAVGFIARPFGGILFGWLGDRIGRRKVLMATIVGIGIATVLIGVLPNYASIGIAAPIILVVLRILQGLAVGGEWSGAVTITAENAPAAKRARYAAVPQLGSPVGTILSSGVFFLTSAALGDERFQDWGWRIPFLLALPMLIASVALRSRLEESPAFLELKDSGAVAEAPLSQVLRGSWRQVLAGSAVALLGIAGFYLVTTFVVSYGQRVLHLDTSLLLAATFIAASFELIVIWAGGRLGERYGSTRVSAGAGVITAILAFPIFMAIGTAQPVLVVVAMTVGVGVVSFAYSVQGAIITSLFPAPVRYTGVSVCGNAAAVLAGLVPLLATAILTVTGDTLWPSACLLILIAVITIAGALTARRISIPEAGLKI
ncbi:MULTISPECIES: MFS transporter [Tsukamurella]|uniref:MFS transporter n=1 Tax=Tsukamurella strandjordii TaxID=147577 RepID=A0AA90NF29_9ACTN|nr:MULTISPECIES: MFS transporter [Tsukamurella]MDP0397275.1 MFS transporter [Tsukamurella strandjordii]GIZ98699.1 MFS transporter [Tsukamurella sp. TY48]